MIWTLELKSRHFRYLRKRTFRPISQISGITECTLFIERIKRSTIYECLHSHHMHNDFVVLKIFLTCTEVIAFFCKGLVIN